MEMLNEASKQFLSNGMLNSMCDRSAEDNHIPYQSLYSNGIIYPVGMDHLGTGEAEDLSSTRHSSGCDDSGVFLEDVPYPQEIIAQPTSLDSNLENFPSRKFLTEDMCQYDIDHNGGLDSDAEKSDDLGLASSSVDSADDLEGDLSPTALKMMPISPSKKKPPPVPPRKSIVNGKFDVPRDSEILKSDKRLPLPPQIFQVYNVEPAFPDTNLLRQTSGRRHSDTFKWKSEECLRSAPDSRWSTRNNEKSISVKDRIAMFKEMESVSSDATLNNRLSNEITVKSSPSVEAIDQQPKETPKSDTLSALDRNTKWYSMYSLPVSPNGSLKIESNNVKTQNHCSNGTTTDHDRESYKNDSNNITPLKINTEQPACVEKQIVSSYPEVQLTNGKRYGRYSFSAATDLLKKNSGLLSIIDSRKQPLQKLKGLVIPDKPFHTPSSKPLPTIVSNDSLIHGSKSEISTKRSPLSAASYKTMSLPRTRNDSKLEQSSDTMNSPESQWKTNLVKSNNVPKYSPAFKTRTLDYSNGVTSSLSPTPPSSITSPLSPPPSSPSSICSSNASSATSVATMQQNVFQFSLTHSKPVTPVLPEKPIMSFPSLSSDIEYEGDNSEDSSTSASPMTSKLTTKHNPVELQLAVRNGIRESKDVPKKQFNSNVTSSQTVSDDSDSASKSQDFKHENRRVDVGLNKSPKFSNSSELQNDGRTPTSTKNKHSFSSYEVNNKTIMTNSVSNFPLCLQETDSVHRGNTNGFFAASQEIQAIKFRAQPLTMSHVIRNSANENASMTQLAVTKADVPPSSQFASDTNGFGEVISRCDGTASYGNQKASMSEYDCSQFKHPWTKSADVIKYKKTGVDSEEEDDCHSSLSHRTEDSRPTTDDYLSDATTDSFDRSLDPDLKPRRLSQQKVVLKAAVDNTDSVQKFKALAEKWEKNKGDVTSPPPIPPVLTPASKKEQSKPYTGPLPTASSFLSSIINSPSKNSSLSNPTTKLPPSLLPRNKYPEIQCTDRSTSLGTPSRGSLEYNHRQRNSEVDNTYSSLTRNDKISDDAVWSEASMSRESYMNGLRDFSDSGSSTDTGSTLSRTTSSDKSNHTNGFASDSISDRQKAADASNALSKLLSGEEQTLKRNEFSNAKMNGKYTDRTFRTTATIQVKNPHERSSHRDEQALTQNLVSTQNKRIGESAMLTTQPEKRDQLEQSWRNRASRTLLSDLQSSRNISRSHASLRDPLEHVRSHGVSTYLSSKNAKSVSVSDIRKAFESHCTQNQEASTKPPPPPLPPRTTVQENGVNKHYGSPFVKQSSIVTDHKRLSSLDSTTSGDSDLPSPPRFESVGSISRDPYGSVTSLASTTSLISPQELQQLIDEANQSLEESCGSKHLLQQEIQVVVLHRELPAGSIGITLAGGSDYEIKEITVHKIISGSLADRDGRLRKGDRVVSINGRNLKGITHREALDILKAPRPEVVLVISRDKHEQNGHLNGHRDIREQKGIQKIQTLRHEVSREKQDDLFSSYKGAAIDDSSRIVSIELQKDVTGLGFSIEGGKDSPSGDKPLVIKRIFKGGVADKDGQLTVGDEIISVNGQIVTTMTRTEAWNFLKKLPEEPIILKARKQALCSS